MPTPPPPSPTLNHTTNSAGVATQARETTKPTDCKSSSFVQAEPVQKQMNKTVERDN